MKYVLVAVRDQKANSFTAPAMQHTREVALRTWANELNNPERARTPEAQNPEDFSLWHVGDYESDTGALAPIMPIQQIAIASDLKKA